MRARKHDATGRSTSSLKQKEHQKIKGAFVAHRVAMIEHPAFAALTLVARRILDRLELEHCRHGGVENGNLIVTYADFEASGIRGRSIAAGLEEVVALGFVEIVRRGRAAAFECRVPSAYRLTYLPTQSTSWTDEWSRLDEASVAEIASRLKASRKARPSQDIDSTGENAPDPVRAKTPLRNGPTTGKNAPEARAKTPPAFSSNDDASGRKGAA